ncbi:DUF6232 family protein [Aerosakkonemataceae cyanobacterium BLCC-F154]|uniref:DUF6232 family protein n=1 Tax=Floridaenema fluviatile BLCC-F154 TaxID=3153640 RepID=A0ABV4Y7Q1_9CYAN
MTSSYPAQQTLYDKGGIRITSTLLEYKKVHYRIRDIYKFQLIEDKKTVQDSDTNQVIFGLLFIIVSLILHNVLGMIVGIVLFIIGSNNKIEEIDYTLQIITNKAEDINITQKNKDEINEIKKALERAISLLSFGQ